jgi:uncharacterized protein
MFNKFFLKETPFFDFFNHQAAIALESAKLFLVFASGNGSIDGVAEKIKDLESQGDAITHHCIEELHKAFITPFEREDIHRLISSIDDIIDEIDATCDCLVVYKIFKPTAFVRELAQSLTDATTQINDAIKLLNNMKNSEAIRFYCQTIQKIEGEADIILRNAVGELFEKESDIRMLIKWKEIYEHLETAIDCCDDVANVIEGVVLEYA